MTQPRKVLIILGQSSLFFYIVHVRLIELISPIVAPLQLPTLERSLLIVLLVLPIAVLACAVYRLVKRKHPAVSCNISNLLQQMICPRFENSNGQLRIFVL